MIQKKFTTSVARGCPRPFFFLEINSFEPKVQNISTQQLLKGYLHVSERELNQVLESVFVSQACVQMINEMCSRGNLCAAKTIK